MSLNLAGWLATDTTDLTDELFVKHIDFVI